MSIVMSDTLFDRFASVLNSLDETNPWVEVTWNSTRSDEEQSAVGRVIGIHGDHRQDTQRLVFVRPDGQRMVVKKDLRIYSPGSHHPLTGDVVDIQEAEPPQ